MTTKEKFCEKLGLTLEEFGKSDISIKDKVSELEECIIELAEIIGGVEE